MGQRIKHRQQGQLIIELLVAFGLATILIPAAILGFISGSNGKAQQELRLRAAGYLREGEEAIRSARDANWSNISTNGTYHPVVSAGVWTLQSGSETIGTDFTRSIAIADVSPADPSKKQVTVTVSWSNLLPTNLTSTFILTRWKNISTQVTTSGTLVGLGFGDWCNPASNPAAQLTMSGGLNVVSVAQGTGDVISFVGSGNSANGLTYADIDVTDPAYPTNPTLTLLGSVSNSPQIKTNGAFNDTSYGYLAAAQHGGKGQGLIVSLSSPYPIIAYLDLGSSASGQSIYMSGGIAFLTATDGYLYAFDVSTRGSCTSNHPCHFSPITGSKLQLAGVGNKVVVVGTNAYVATTSTTNQLQIINESTPATPSISASVSVGNGKSGVDLFIDPARLRAYLVTAYASSSTPDFFTIDVNSTDSWYKQVLNEFVTVGSMNPTGVVYVTGNRAVIVGTGASQNYQVVDVTNESVPPYVIPTTCGNQGVLNSSYNIYGVATLFTNAKRAYSYIITSDSGKEYKLIEGGPGGGAGGNGGTFTSPVFNAGKSVVFNSFTTTNLQPSGITASYQIAVSADCATFNFTGNYGSSGGQIPLNLNPGQCFQYKVSFANGGGATSASTTVILNYSP